MQTKLMDNKTAEWFLNRLESARPEAADGSNTAQIKINQWARSIGGDKGVIFYDLDKAKEVDNINYYDKTIPF